MTGSTMFSPRLALATAALAPLLAAASPQEAPPTAAQDPVAVVIRYDPATIYLTTELVQSLCDSSVRARREEGPLAGVVFELEVEAFPGREHQPPGVFPCRVRPVGAQAPLGERRVLVDQLLGELRDALGARLTDGRVSRTRDLVHAMEAERDAIHEHLATIRANSAAHEQRKALKEQMLLSKASVEALEVDLDMSSASWRVAKAKAEEQEGRLRAAEARLMEARLDLKRRQAGAKNGLVSELEVQKALRDSAGAEAKLLEIAAKVEEASAQTEVIGLRQKSLEAKTMSERQRLADIEERFARTALGRGEGGGETAEDIPLAMGLKMIQERITRAKRELNGVIEVRVERW